MTRVSNSHTVCILLTLPCCVINDVISIHLKNTHAHTQKKELESNSKKKQVKHVIKGKNGLHMLPLGILLFLYNSMFLTQGA